MVTNGAFFALNVRNKLLLKGNKIIIKKNYYFFQEVIGSLKGRTMKETVVLKEVQWIFPFQSLFPCFYPFPGKQAKLRFCAEQKHLDHCDCRRCLPPPHHHPG